MEKVSPKIKKSKSIIRTWLLPLSLLAGMAFTVIALVLLVDAPNASDQSEVFKRLFSPNPEAAAATLSNAAEVVAAILAIAITVVAIIVELAANRYTHRITELFVSNPVNFFVTGFFVITALVCLWVNLAFDIQAANENAASFIPYTGITVAMGMLTLCLLILLPYFGYVFAFLNPIQIVDRIRKHTFDTITKRKTTLIATEKKKSEAIRGIEQLSDVSLNAMENKDKGVSMASVNSLFRLLNQYQSIKKEQSSDWFQVEGRLTQNPDFISMSPKVLRKVSEQKVWFEMKVLRQYQTIYNEALNRIRDVNYLIAINTRKLAKKALENQDHALFELLIKFLNTYLRSTINARDVRTAYNVLNQYRILAEQALSFEGGRYSVEIAQYLNYYAHLSFHANLPFITETVAYDLCSLNEYAFKHASKNVHALLNIFLDVDKEADSEAQEASLRGVRKAQIKLATFYLQQNSPEYAKRVYNDMEHESATRLSSIREELLSVTSEDFWEVSDRGHNFDFLAKEQKEKLHTFFAWFGEKLPNNPDIKND